MVELAPLTQRAGLDFEVGNLSSCLEGLVAPQPRFRSVRNLLSPFLSFDLR